MQSTKNSERLIERYASYPTEIVEYEIEGKKYTVIRHFTGEKSISEAVKELAVSRADKDMGLNGE